MIRQANPLPEYLAQARAEFLAVLRPIVRKKGHSDLLPLVLEGLAQL
jgi:hypothetical protein